IDYGEYTFDSQNFNEEQHGGGGAPVAQAPNTTVFAAGAAGVNAVPDQQAVRARLIDIGQNRAYGLAAARLILGRETSSDIIINDLNASRNHAELRFEPQGVWVITDLGSTNGTKVNGRIITSQPLYEGDQITIGVTNLIFTQE
ncbi:MAG: FHA domain-containing protein, partial [Raoultibacter sp.]